MKPSSSADDSEEKQLSESELPSLEEVTPPMATAAAIRNEDVKEEEDTTDKVEVVDDEVKADVAEQEVPLPTTASDEEEFHEASESVINFDLHSLGG